MYNISYMDGVKDWGRIISFILQNHTTTFYGVKSISVVVLERDFSCRTEGWAPISTFRKTGRFDQRINGEYLVRGFHSLYAMADC